MNPTRPIVLSIAGHDPTGGAGIQADIEAVAALGGHAVTAVSCLTVQDTRNVLRLWPVPVELLMEQARALFDDLPVAAVKLGLLGSAETVAAVAGLLAEHPSLPVICDPVLAAGGGTDLAGERLIKAMRELLMPRVDLLTPNSPEARRLSGEKDLPAAAERLLELGCGAVLITGTHEAGTDISHGLYRPGQPMRHWQSPRLPGEYHGSGCTLASAIAARVAAGDDWEQAIHNAQSFTLRALQQADSPGHGQALPRRIP